MPYDERNDKGFQKRFGYFVASGTLDLITMWVYIFFLNAFLDIEKKYQPILGWVQYYWSWINSSFSAHIYCRNMVAPGISHLRCVWWFSFKLKFIKFVNQLIQMFLNQINIIFHFQNIPWSAKKSHTVLPKWFNSIIATQILGLISPIIKHVFIRALLPLAYKAAGSSEIDHVKIGCKKFQSRTFQSQAGTLDFNARIFDPELFYLKVLN